MEQLIEIFTIDVWIPGHAKIKKNCQKRFNLSDTERLKRLIKAKTGHENSEVFLHYKILQK